MAYFNRLVCFLFQMDQLVTCMAKETEAQACGPPGQWGLDGDLLRCKTSLCILQQSPGKQPVLAMDYITVSAFSLCASSQELLFLLKNPTAINLPECRFPVKKIYIYTYICVYIYLHSHLQISNQFEARHNCSERKEKWGALVFWSKGRGESWINQVLFPLEELALCADMEVGKACLWRAFKSEYESSLSIINSLREV